MPIIVTKDGKRIRLTDQEIRQGLEKGQWWGFSKDQAPEVALVDPKTGNVFGEKFDPAQIHKALSQGYRFETEDEEQKRYRKEKYSTVTEQAKTFGENFLSGITLGGSDVLGTATGIVDPRARKAREEENPKLAIAGEVTGTVLPSLVTGPGAAVAKGGIKAGAKTLGKEILEEGVEAGIKAGVKGAAKEAVEGGVKAGIKKALSVTPPALLTKGTHALEKGIAKNLGGGKLAEVAGATIGQGVEGAVYGLGSAISDSAIEDKPLWSESTLAEVGLGGLIGGAFGGGLKGLGALTGKAKGSLSNKAFNRKLKQDPGLYEKVAGTATGIEPAKLAQFTRGQQGKINRKIATTADKELEKMSREYADAYTALDRHFENVSLHHRDMKPNQMLFKVKHGNETQTLTETANLLSEGVDGIGQGELYAIFATMANKANKGQYGFEAASKSVLRNINQKMKNVRRLEARYRRMKPGYLPQSLNNSLFTQLDSLKKDLGKVRKKMGRAHTPMSADLAAMDKVEEAYEMLRTKLEDVDLWGDAAIAQKEINAPFTDWLSVEDAKVRSRLKYKMSRQVETRDWAGVFAGDSGEAQKFLSDINTPKADLDLDHYVKSLERQDKLIDAHKKYYKLGDAAEDAEKAKAAIAKMQKLQEKAKDLTRLRDDLAEINAKGLSGGMMGGLGGYAAGGLPGAIVGTGIMQPGRVIQARAIMDRFFDFRGIQNRAAKKIDKGLKSFFKGEDKLRRVAVVTTQKTISQKRSDYRRYRAELDKIAANPGVINEKIGNRLQGLEQADPELLAHLGMTTAKATKYLTDTLPPQAKSMLPGILEADPADVPDYELAKWLRRYNTVNDPQSALDDMANGELTKEQVETLQAVYPRLYQQMQQKALEQVAADPKSLDYGRKVQLSALLGIPLDASLTPENLAKLQAYYQTPEGEAASSGAIMDPKGLSKLTIAEDHLSKSERLQNKE